MGVKIVPLTSGSQQALEKTVSQYLTSGVGEWGTAYPKQLTPDIPESLYEAFDRVEQGAGSYSDLLQSALAKQVRGEAAVRFDPTEATKLFDKTYATPMMEMFRREAIPAIRESYAGSMQGTAFGSPIGRGVEAATSRFMGENITQPFYNLIEGERAAARASQEYAAARVPGAATLLSQLPQMEFSGVSTAVRDLMGIEQQGLSAAYQDWLRRVPEPGWAAQSGIPYMTQPTSEAFYKESGGGGLGGALGSLAGAGAGWLAAGGTIGPWGLAAGGALPFAGQLAAAGMGASIGGNIFGK